MFNIHHFLHFFKVKIVEVQMAFDLTNSSSIVLKNLHSFVDSLRSKGEIIIFKEAWIYINIY